MRAEDPPPSVVVEVTVGALPRACARTAHGRAHA
jgi:hypothetical protein